MAADRFGDMKLFHNFQNVSINGAAGDDILINTSELSDEWNMRHEVRL